MNIQKITSDAFERYNSVSFRDLINKYYLNEKSIIDELINIVENQFIRIGYVVKNRVCSKGNNNYRIQIEFSKFNRSLIIYISPFYTPILDKVEESISFKDLIGLVKEIKIIYPKHIPIEIKSLRQLLQHTIISNYNGLEDALIRNSDELNKRFFRILYDRVDLQFKIKNRHDLIKKYWFVIGHSDMFSYFLDIEKISELTSFMKSNQIDTYSPFELIVSFLKTPLNFKESLGAESIKSHKRITKKWDELNYISNKSVFALAERIIYPAEAHTVNSICETRKYILGVASSNDVEEEINQIINEIKKEICEIFIKGVKDYSFYFKLLNRIKLDTENNQLSTAVGKFFGSATAEFIKGINS